MPAAEQDADARQKKPQLDEEKLQKLEEKVRTTKEEIRAKREKEAKETADAEAKLEKQRRREKAHKEKEMERPREDKEGGKNDAKFADPTPEQKQDWQQGQQCPLCEKWLRSSSEFALSQHLWAVHPDHPESKKRSDAHKIVLKERGKSQARAPENKNSQWHGDQRQKSLSRDPNKRWQDDSRERRERSQASPRRSPSSTRHHSRASRRSRSSTGSEGMLAEFFRTTRALNRKSWMWRPKDWNTACLEKNRDPRGLIRFAQGFSIIYIFDINLNITLKYLRKYFRQK